MTLVALVLLTIDAWKAGWKARALAPAAAVPAVCAVWYLVVCVCTGRACPVVGLMVPFAIAILAALAVLAGLAGRKPRPARPGIRSVLGLLEVLPPTRSWSTSELSAAGRSALMAGPLERLFGRSARTGRFQDSSG
jgi:hypothetical protein